MDEIEQEKLGRIYELVRLLSDTYRTEEMAKLPPGERDLLRDWPYDMQLAYIFHRDRIRKAAARHGYGGAL